MEASSATAQMSCFATGALLRVRNAGRPRFVAARQVVAMAEQPKGMDRRGALATLAGFVAGVSYAGIAEAAIDSSALLEKYEQNKGGPKASVKKAAPVPKPAPAAAPKASVEKAAPVPKPAPAAAPAPAPAAGPAPAARAGAASSSGFSPALFGGAAALIAGALALGNSSADTAKGKKVRAAKKPVKKIRTGTVSSKFSAKKKIVPKPTYAKKVVRPAVKKVPKPVPRPAPKPAAKPAAKKPGKESTSDLIPVAGVGLALAAGLVFLSPGQRATSKTTPVVSSPAPSATKKTKSVASAPVAVSKVQPAPPVKAARKPAAKTASVSSLKAAPPSKAARKVARKPAKTVSVSSLKAAPPSKAVRKVARKPAKTVSVSSLKAAPASKAARRPAPKAVSKPAPKRPRKVVSSGPKPRPKVVKRKQIVVPAKRGKKASKTSAGTLADGLFALVLAGTAVYFLGERKEGSSSSSSSSSPPKASSTAASGASSPLTPDEEITQRQQDASGWIDSYKDRSNKGLFGFRKKDD
ncbi:unnamed protein product [Ostreobium quekettii]|uniref:Uncharacterized protein n=1 Tax=Ostreobium quekettii TaxID=121088 RepID=A0A8S1J3D2_9CHLO|nr:unnamed protein product [Ostreobium quekettii]|eukprot:evm.model.scf_1611.5 EVM.evm.TU.scf_1611.5   scf_1611:15651-17945(+)